VADRRVAVEVAVRDKMVVVVAMAFHRAFLVAESLAESLAAFHRASLAESLVAPLDIVEADNRTYY
jgi:hypothetical protein